MSEQQPETDGRPSTLRVRKEQARQKASGRTPPPPSHKLGQPVPLQPVATSDSAPADAILLDEPVGSFWAPIELVAPNPRNTRDVKARPAELQILAKKIADNGQQHATPVVTRAAYLAIFQEDEAKIGATARWVQGPGARRRAAQLLNGSPVLKVEVQNDIASSREKFLDVTLGENIDREQLDPIEEARAVELLVEEAGSAAEAGRRRSRSDAWVFQKLNLLELHPDVQNALRAEGDARLPVRVVRTWHKKSLDQQVDLLLAWRRRNDPTFTADAGSAPDGETPGKVSRREAALTRLGTTLGFVLGEDDPDAIAEVGQAIRAKVPPQQRRALAEELLREDDS